MMATGQSWTFTFTVPGTYSYYCSVHPDMRAQVVVLPAETQEPAPPPVEVPQETAAAPPPSRPHDDGSCAYHADVHFGHSIRTGRSGIDVPRPDAAGGGPGRGGDD